MEDIQFVRQVSTCTRASIEGILFVWQASCLYYRHLVYMVGIQLVRKASILYGRHLQLWQMKLRMITLGRAFDFLV